MVNGKLYLNKGENDPSEHNSVDEKINCLEIGLNEIREKK